MTRSGITFTLQWPDCGLGVFFTAADGKLFPEPVLVCMIGPLVVEWTLPTRKA